MTEVWILTVLIVLGLCPVGFIAVGWAADRRITARTTAGERMTDYDGAEPLTADEERDHELALDALDEQRHAEQEKAAAAAEPDSDDDECNAETIDGSYTYCGCPDCDTRQAEDDEQFGECA